MKLLEFWTLKIGLQRNSIVSQWGKWLWFSLHKRQAPHVCLRNLLDYSGSLPIKNDKTDPPDFHNKLLPHSPSSLAIKVTAVLTKSHFVYATPIMQHIFLNSWAKHACLNAISALAIPIYAFWLPPAERRNMSQFDSEKRKINTTLAAKMPKIGCWFSQYLFWEYCIYFSLSTACCCNT